MATGLAPTNDLESAILVTLDPGTYTAIVKGKNNTRVSAWWKSTISIRRRLRNWAILARAPLLARVLTS